DGNEIARILGVPPGPAVGDALRALVRAQILGRVGTRTEAETYLCRRTRARAGTATSPTPSDAG
ncbi:MAG: poly(A) polymerase, partial [Acidobacteriota bacterium]|nr:poly(A) polymerase [Acidobacteriota bacterium]